MKRPGGPTPTLSVVVPTYRESANVPVLFERIKAALDGLPWEMIVVDDDSPDGTSDVAFALAADDRRLRCLRRVNRSGLAGAVIEGWMSSSADFVAVIDGDLQHDETILREMYHALAKGAANLAIGTRMREAGAGLSPARQKLSDLGAWFFSRIAGAAVTDPMSGFFMIRREIVSRLAPRLSPDGFKILVDVILSAGGDLKIVEVPYRFRKRDAGESKLTPLVGLDFLGLVVHHATGGALPIRFVLFAMIGASGLVVHIVTLSAVLHWFGASDLRFRATHRHHCRHGEQLHPQQRDHLSFLSLSGLGLIEGFAAFALGCSVGAIANIDIASWLYKRQSDLVGRGARRRAPERRLELRGEHEPHLASVAAAARGLAEPPPRWPFVRECDYIRSRSPKTKRSFDGGRPVRRPGLLRRFRRSRLQADLSGAPGTRGR